MYFGQIINLKSRAINRNAVYRRHTQVTLKWRHQFGALVVMTSKQCRLFTLHGLCVEVSPLAVLLTFNQLCSSKDCLSTWRRLRPKRCSSIKLQNLYCAFPLEFYGLDIRSGSQRHRHFVGLFNVPVQAPTRDLLFYTAIPTHRPY